MNRLKVLLIYGKNDHNGTHISSCMLFSHEFRIRGFDPVILKIVSQQDVLEMVEILKNNRVFCVHVEQLQLINIRLNGQNVFELFDVPVCSQLRDNWFYPWVLPNLRRLPEKSFVEHVDRTITPLLQYVSGRHIITNHSAQNFQSVELFSRKENCDVPIFVGGCADVDELLANLKAKSFPTGLIDDVIDRVRSIVAVPADFWLVEISSEMDEVLFLGSQIPVEAFHDLFWFAMTQIRSSFLTHLAEADCELYVKGGWKPPKHCRARVFSGGRLKHEIEARVASAPMVLSDQAAFDVAIGERTATSILRNQPSLMRESYALGVDICKANNIRTFSSHSDLPDLISDAMLSLDTRADSNDPGRSFVPRFVYPGSYVQNALFAISSM